MTFFVIYWFSNWFKFEDTSKTQLLERVVAKDVNSGVIDVDLHLPIRTDERYQMVEVLLLQESNIEIVVSVFR